MARRFMALSDVAETLDVSASQAYALVRSGELPAIKVGGRGQFDRRGQPGGGERGVLPACQLNSSHPKSPPLAVSRDNSTEG